MNNTDLRNLVPEGTAAPESDTLSILVQGALVFSLAIGGFALYRNPDLARSLVPGFARGWIPGLDGSNPVMATPAAPPVKLPAAALAAIADDNKTKPGQPLTMTEEMFANSMGGAAEAMAPDGTADEKADLKRGLQGLTNSQNTTNVIKLGTLMSGRPDIMNVNIYPGGNTSRAMATACIAKENHNGYAVDYDAAALTRVTSCYMTTNVERLCSSVQKQVLVDVIEHYFASRDTSNRRADKAGSGGPALNSSDPKPADWLGNGPKTLAANFTRLVTQGYLVRSDFGFFLDDDFRKILADTPVVRQVCGPARS